MGWNAELYAGTRWVCVAQRPDQDIEAFGKVEQGSPIRQRYVGGGRNGIVFEVGLGVFARTRLRGREAPRDSRRGPGAIETGLRIHKERE